MFREFIDSVFNWGKQNKHIDSILLAGSYARHEEKPDSDIDLIIVVHSRDDFLNNLDWLEVFGKVSEYSIEDYGRVQSVRVFYKNGFEVEFGITEIMWTEIPADPGTFQVISDGSRIIIDKTGRLKNLRDEVLRQLNQ